MKVLVYDRQAANSNKIRPTSRWFGSTLGRLQSKPGCCVHDVDSNDLREAERLAKRDHREKCLTSRSARVRGRYSKDWDSFSNRIRFARALGQCECLGECGLHSYHGGPRRCEERNGKPAVWAKGTIVLTVAHLNRRGGPCSCEPLCSIPEHVKAMCQRCHLRYDTQRHIGNARKTRAEKVGQMELALS